MVLREKVLYMSVVDCFAAAGNALVHWQRQSLFHRDTALR